MSSVTWPPVDVSEAHVDVQDRLVRCILDEEIHPEHAEHVTDCCRYISKNQAAFQAIRVSSTNVLKEALESLDTMRKGGDVYGSLALRRVERTVMLLDLIESLSKKSAFLLRHQLLELEAFATKILPCYPLVSVLAFHLITLMETPFAIDEDQQ